MGRGAARRAPTSPLTHAATAAGVAVVAYVVFRVGDAVVRNRPLNAPSVAILVILSVAVGLVGGLIGRARPRRGT